jgi:hypothetical protein
MWARPVVRPFDDGGAMAAATLRARMGPEL